MALGLRFPLTAMGARLDGSGRKGTPAHVPAAGFIVSLGGRPAQDGAAATGAADGTDGGSQHSAMAAPKLTAQLLARLDREVDAAAPTVDGQAALSGISTSEGSVRKKEPHVDKSMFYSNGSISTCDTLPCDTLRQKDGIDDETCEEETEDDCLSTDDSAELSDLSRVVHINGKPIREECLGFDCGRLGNKSCVCDNGNECVTDDSDDDASMEDDDSMSVISSIVHIDGRPVIEVLDASLRTLQVAHTPRR
mmetsp:Transcript_82458/g.214867  ORF Transcript_82458/g.214867 Transcript_82458/m.214867 type:complete len:251 (+) Transcript_82458:113-865(+)